MWFEDLTGFKEENPEQVRKNLEVNGNILTSLINGRSFQSGKLSTPTLEQLRTKVELNNYNGKLSLTEEVGNVQHFHCDKENNGAFFQAASQFNLLEMVGPMVTPERGVGIYENDYTQGPACAVACGAGTIYRNYFAKVNDRIGQTADNQINCLRDIGVELNNQQLNLWSMQNGYALSSKDGLINISKQIKSKSSTEYENLKGKLRIGIQWDTEVTINNTTQFVTQAYCSALPVTYSHVDSEYWEDFARLILEATYEATFYAALLNYEKTDNNRVFLTLVGGGAFGNHYSWIFDAIRKTIEKFKNTPLDIRIISYGGSNPSVKSFVEDVLG